MAITHSLTLDVHKRTSRVPPEVVCRQGESGTETISASIAKDGAAYTSSCTNVRLDILHADGTWARVTGTKSSSTVTVTLPSAALSSPGLCRLAHFVFYNSSNSNVETTEGFLLRILPAVDGSGQQAKDYDDQLSELYKKWLAYEETAEAQESARVSAEATRVSNENTRVSNEKTRVSQETARVAAEKARAAEYTGIVNTCNTATSAAQGAAATANAAANTALEIANTAAQNSAGDSDIAALKNDVTVLGSKVADLLGEFYYLDGVIYCPSSKVTYSGTGITLASTCSYSGTTIALA